MAKRMVDKLIEKHNLEMYEDTPKSKYNTGTYYFGNDKVKVNVRFGFEDGSTLITIRPIEGEVIHYNNLYGITNSINKIDKVLTERKELHE